SDAQVKAIGKVDVLMVPIGGIYTINGEQARKIVKQIKPRLYVVPMHYGVPGYEDLLGPDEFLEGQKNVKKLLNTNEPVILLDQLLRPAAIIMKDGHELAVHLPLIYPESHTAESVFALGMETDHICPDNGPTRCIGGKLLLVGDGAEVRLAECRMIEVR